MTTVVVATSGGLHQVSGDEVRTELAGCDVAAVTRDDGGWWAIVDGGVWRGAPDGRWEPAATTDLGQPTCLLAAGGGLLVGTAGAHLVRLTGGQLVPVAPFEHVEGREDWHTPWGGPPATRSLAAAPDATLYVNVHVGGVVRSGDGGATWQPTIDIDTDVHQVIAGPHAGDVYAATGRDALAESHDHGRTWSFAGSGLHASYLRGLAIAGDTLLVTASSGAHGGQAAVYRRLLDSDGPFERCRQGLPGWFAGNIDSGCVDAADAAAAFATADGDLYTSSDGGRSWTLATSGLPSVRQVVVTTP